VTPPGELTAGQETTRSRVALTFDDIPAHGALPPGKTRTDVARSIVNALREAQAPPAYAFLNGKGLDDAPQTAEVLRVWRAAGHLLANHTYSHMDLDANTVEAFWQDVLANEPALRAAMGENDWRWFRYPYLHAGDTREKRRAAARLLKESGYRIAEVSLSFDDWAYSDPYARCLAQNDVPALEWLERSYLGRAARAIERAREDASRVHGREVPQVMLLHFGGIQMAMLPRLLDLLRARGFGLVTLDEAQGDPAYARDAGADAASEETAKPAAAAARDGYASPAPPADDDLARLSALCR
jgi:peptidoglycan/xylan/chitin deacetylase (PgdA/CDA1 family)